MEGVAERVIMNEGVEGESVRSGRRDGVVSEQSNWRNM